MNGMTVNDFQRSASIIEDRETPLFWESPNKYAANLEVDLNNEVVTFGGYQQFVLTRNMTCASFNDLSLQKKQDVLKSYFQPRYLAGRTVLDIGANAGFFSYWALQKGADQATAIDIDTDYLKAMEQVKARLGFDNLEIINANFIDWTRSADVVLALALIHWTYSCTALSGSLDKAIERLSGLTNYMLILEWIDPEDAAINFFHHLDWNRDFIQGPYNLEEFEGALSRHFATYEMIGEVSRTRKLYVAFCADQEADLSGPLPFLRDKQLVIYSRGLARSEGIDYWSRLYDTGDVILKQATLHLAEREASFLRQLTSDYFPRVLSASCRNGYSVLELERVQGTRLSKAAIEIAARLETFYDFIVHALNILEELSQKGIVHRDIRSENILVRNGKPVLIDFGWSISDETSCLTPNGLGGMERPPDGSFCDVFSMGKIFERLNSGRNRVLSQVIELMTLPDASLRITHLDTLRLLFTKAVELDARDQGLSFDISALKGDQQDAKIFDFVIRQLLQNLSQLKASFDLLKAEQERQGKEIAERDSTVEALSRQLIETRGQLRGSDESVAGLSEEHTRLRVQVEERDQSVAALCEDRMLLMAQVEDRDDLIRVHREAIARLQGKLTESESNNSRVSTDLSIKVRELDQITQSLGWRLLRRYGKFKYRRLLPVYRMFGLWPR
jgi:serine/threonine protein kinase